MCHTSCGQASHHSDVSTTTCCLRARSPALARTNAIRLMVRGSGCGRQHALAGCCNPITATTKPMMLCGTAANFPAPTCACQNRRRSKRRNGRHDLSHEPRTIRIATANPAVDKHTPETCRPRCQGNQPAARPNRAMVTPAGRKTAHAKNINTPCTMRKSNHTGQDSDSRPAFRTGHGTTHQAMLSAAQWHGPTELPNMPAVEFPSSTHMSDRYRSLWPHRSWRAV